MKLPYRLFKKGNGYYFCEDRENGKQHSLRTKNEAEAVRLLNARNEAKLTPGFALHIAKAYLAAADPTVAKRKWRFVADELVQTKRGENAVRWQRALKDKALARILDLKLIETRAEHFLAAMKAGTVSTNVFLRRLHNFALGVGWVLAPVLPPKQWPAVVVWASRGIHPVRPCGLFYCRTKSVAAQTGHQAFGIKHGFVPEHEINRARQLDGHHRIGLELVAVHPCLQ